MHQINKLVRHTVIPIAYKLGIDRAIRLFRPNTHLNLMYHGVVEGDGTHFTPRNLNVDQFDAQLKYLKKNFDIIRLHEAFDRIKSGESFNRKTISISFDDGYRNNLDVALPILEKHNIPATFFISSNSLEDMPIRCLWGDLIAALKRFYPEQSISIDQYEFKHLIDARHNLLLTDFLKSCKPEDRSRHLQYLIETFDLKAKLDEIPDALWKLMDQGELKQLANSNLVDIGSHGHDHYSLSQIPLDQAIQDLVQSKKLLEVVLEKPVKMLAYPYGSYSRALIDAAENIGFTQQYAVRYHFDEDQNDPRILNRCGISSTTTLESNMLRINTRF